MKWVSLILLIALGLVTSDKIGAEEPRELVAAREHRLRGRYEEAAETLDELPEAVRKTAEFALEHARLQRETGEMLVAIKTLQAAENQHAQRADLPALRAEILAFRGDRVAALAAVTKALAIDPQEPRARLVQADLWAESGRLAEASEAYRWFVRYYNQAQPEDAETLLVIGRGAAQYARWKGSSQIFDFLVNTLCADVLKADPLRWEAHGLAGELLLEKYNRPEGLAELKNGLALNPRAATLRISLAAEALEEMQYDTALEELNRALATSPQHPVALRWKALALISQGRVVEADPILQTALKLAPSDQRLIALAVYRESVTGGNPSLERFQDLLNHFDRIDDWDTRGSQYEGLIVALVRQNPLPGYFLQELGRLYQGQRKLRLAEICYEQAIQQMPQLSQPKADLAMLHFQAGRMEAARQRLEEAFAADPYHVRISNMRKVLKVLDGYGTVSTPHFVIRADSQLDQVLAQFMAVELEAVYADITREYGFEPLQRTQLEIYNKSRGLPGHQWFSARMIGLPWLQTIGASTGQIIALTSPTATDEPYNWARVVRHEFVHVVTLQQTDFNIPHWFTEALATKAEGYPYPDTWPALLVKRFRANKLRNLDDLHLGFQRAESPEDWNFAYCQSVLYADYFLERFGPDALRKLLNAYRDTRSTDEALKTAFQVEKSDVEAGYQEFLKRRVDDIVQQGRIAIPLNAEAIAARAKVEPQSLDAQAELAALFLQQNNIRQAESLAKALLEREPRHSPSAVVLAEVHRRQELPRLALAVLQRAYLPTEFQPRLWKLLGELQLTLKDAEALALFQKACALEPENVFWWRGLAQAAEQAENRSELQRGLEQVSRLDGDSFAARSVRAEMALEDQQFAVAVDYARRALQIDVMDANIHATLARGYAGLQDVPKALAAYDVALQLKPGDRTLMAERAKLAPSSE